VAKFGGKMAKIERGHGWELSDGAKKLAAEAAEGLGAMDGVGMFGV
jgi:hypothetical protein